MNIALWVVQGLLGAAFVMAGVMKALNYETAKQKIPWVKDVPKGLTLFIGASELLAGVGLILPWATKTLPWLTPLAAVGLALIMLLAIPFHMRRKEGSGAVMNVVFLALAAFVVLGRGLHG